MIGDEKQKSLVNTCKEIEVDDVKFVSWQFS